MAVYVDIRVSAAAYADHDNPLTAAVRDYMRQHPALRGWELTSRWATDDRDEIIITVPDWAVPTDPE